MSEARTLLSVVELGGYPNFTALYRRYGYQVESITSGRKAISRLKQGALDLVVTEFNYQTEFRDRTSSLESILATLQGRSDVKVVVFYSPGEAQELARLRERFPHFIAVALPVNEAQMEVVLQGL